MFVLTVDQQSSRVDGDRVPEALDLLAPIPTLRAFERSVGDEFQGILTRADAVVAALITLQRSGNWHIGVGLGTINTPLPPHARAADGPALRSARAAVEEAKRARAATFTAADEALGQACATAQALWRVMAVILAGRTERQWQISALAERASGVAIAKGEGISPQSVSSILRAGHHREITEARAALVHLLQPWEENHA